MPKESPKMTYVMSDIHGMFEAYKAMLETIDFDDSDNLYILGDICDRGPATARVYLDIIERKNVFCIKGNHEELLLECLPQCFGFLRKSGLQKKEWAFEDWSGLGGDATAVSLLSCNKEDIIRIYNFIDGLPYCRIIEVNGKTYILVHAGLENYSNDKPIESYTAAELTWESPDPNAKLWDDGDKYLVVGHTPTIDISDKPFGCIHYGKGNVIMIDCGAYFKTSGGRLGCLCLETGAEYYI